ncbi:MAG TPA: hypothetical protein VHX38_18725 [Pseudonocardiaceae bacterium]|jgi:hypothetical protein|nr:hypothetical protein [Pseudonocardiaceae bacterium]
MAKTAGRKNVRSQHGTTRNLDLNAARAATRAGGTMSDMDADDGVPTGGYTTNDTGLGGASNGVNAASQPASITSLIRPGGGNTP